MILTKKQTITLDILENQSNGITEVIYGGSAGNKGHQPNQFTKLNEQQVLEIRSKFKPRVYTRKMLSLEYGVAETTIKDIVLRRTWTNI